MPVKFVTKVLKGLLGGSETPETDEETSVTVERERAGGDTTETGHEDDTDNGVESADQRADDDRAAKTGEQTDETGEQVAEPDDSSEHPGAGVPVDEIRGVGPTYSERLTAAGIETVADVAVADIEEIADAAEVSGSRASDWQSQATDW